MGLQKSLSALHLAFYGRCSDSVPVRECESRVAQISLRSHIGYKLYLSAYIGDSLESDIRGGEVAGIDSVWYNPGRKPNDTDIRPTAEAADYGTLYQILTQEL